ncbi:hypothetical protein [Chishuiella sp.]|uniref:hypothetical protein n=1 Tax=Chishuiella sp. TaxID=1969467 RepID=UPI0028AF06AD|nr:hypothetical protein [Chishuiella sp.]
MQNITDLHNAISAIEDFSHSSQLPYPEEVKQMMLKEEFPKLVQDLREAYEKLNPKKNVNAISRKSSFPIRGTI